MKKAIALLLALIMMFALCGCGSKELTWEEKEKIYEEVKAVKADSGKNSSSGSTDTTVSGNVENSDNDLISIEEFSINPNRGWREIKIRNMSGKTVPCFCCSYVFIDKNGDVIDTTGHITTSRIMIEDGQAFTEQDQSVMADGDYSKVAAVKFTEYTLRDVLNGEFRWVEEYAFINPPIFIQNSDGTFSKYSDSKDAEMSDSLSVAECIESSPENESIEKYQLNDTVETDTVRLTVSEFFYKDEAVGKITQLAKIKPDDGEIWACIGLTLENIGKNQIVPYDILNAKIDYNNGYVYSTDEATAAILNFPDFDAYYYRAGGISMKLSPLTSSQYILLISCSPVLQEDKDSPINVIFELPDGSGTSTFIYKLQ